MRSWLIFLVIACLAIPFTGCQTFRGPLGKNAGQSKKKGGLLGVGRRDGLDQEEVLDPLGARDSNRILLDDLAPSQLSTTWRTQLSRPNQAKAQAYFDQADQLYNKGVGVLEANKNDDSHQQYFIDAAQKYRLASASWPDSTLDEDASYFEGESYFFADHYMQSNRAFEKLIARYSGTKYLDRAEQLRYSMAVYWLQLAENSAAPSLSDPKRPKLYLAGEARRVLQQIRLDDPTGKLADDAALALGKAFMQDERYYEAGDTFEDLRQNYPGSEHQFDAHMLELQCRVAGYQGKSYDDTPLRKADDLMKSIVRQFPKESQGQLEYLEQQAALIKSQIAERDYSMAQYFEGRGENLAAKIYYEQVAEKYKDTKLAQSVQQQIAEVSKLPPKPAQHAKWLIDMFPNPEAAKPVIVAGNNEPIFR